MTRKEFANLTTGIISGLGIHPLLDNSTQAAAKTPNHALDESYLAKGLTGMAGSKGWFNAHWGAGILAGYYLCKENNLSKETVAGIKRQLDSAIDVQSSQFTPLAREAADEALIEDIPKAMIPAMNGGLRAHGHAVIFASLSTRALRDAPQMAQPTLIKSLCNHSQVIARKTQKVPDHLESYVDTQAMIEALFDNLIRFKDLLGRPAIQRPNFTHMTTHTEALMNLELMGYGDLAKAGHIGHRAHLDEPVPSIDPTTPRQENPATLKKIMSQGYWENGDNIDHWNRQWNTTDNRNGYWIAAGHLFKVLYSYHRLIGRIQDKEKVQLCSEILLERYFNPNVQGG
jgi:hypothetical protein